MRQSDYRPVEGAVSHSSVSALGKKRTGAVQEAMSANSQLRIFRSEAANNTPGSTISRPVGFRNSRGKLSYSWRCDSASHISSSTFQSMFSAFAVQMPKKDRQ